MEEKIYDVSELDLAQRMVGKQIVAIDKEHSRIILNDGAVLDFEDTADCCAYFEVSGIHAIDLENNIITAVTKSKSTLDDVDLCGDEFDFVVLSEAKEIARVQIDGTASSGDYCLSVNLIVHLPETGEVA